MVDFFVITAFAIAAVPFSIFWLRKRRRENAGLRCWNCGHDLNSGPRMSGMRCPKCGHAVETDD